MKVEIKKLLTANSALMGNPNYGMVGLLQQSMQPDLAFKLSMAQKAMQSHLESVDVARKKLVAEYEADVEQEWPEDYKPKKGEKKAIVKEIPADKQEEVNDKFDAFLSTEVEVAISKIPQGDFQKYGLKEVKPQQLSDIEFMINLKK